MTNLARASAAAASIRALARRAVAVLPASSKSRATARRRVRRPVDYMRYAEFEAILEAPDLRGCQRVLDVSSPQWLSIYLASKWPDVHFTYINILPGELESFAEITGVLGLTNIEYALGDARQLDFADATFDRVLSVSVIEHVSPEVGGDVRSLEEVARVLKPGGELFVTVPYKSRSNIVYVDGAVYERDSAENNFFAREYDATTFESLVDASPLTLADAQYITERRGAFAVDYFEWGPGKGGLRSRLLGLRNVAGAAFGTSPDGILARRYLSVSRNPDGRLVNIFARLAKER